jgi:hypothetical protein
MLNDMPITDTRTIRITASLHRRLSERSRVSHATLDQTIAAALDSLQEQEFWRAVDATMGTPEAEEDLKQEAASFDGALADGLGGEEYDWDSLA